MGSLALQAISPSDLARALDCELGEARKIVSAVHRDRSIDGPLVGVRRVVMERARAAGHVPALTVVSEQASKVDPFVKYVVQSGDDVVETVRIPLEREGRFSVCVSSQAGCALACAFCATGRL